MTEKQIDNEFICNLNAELENATDLQSLNSAFEKITKSLNSSCDKLAQSYFDYVFSQYLKKNYIEENKTKVEISREINMPPSTVYNYIRKYKLKKSRKQITEKSLQTMRATCQERYGVNHTGELREAHIKQRENTKNNRIRKINEILNR